MGEGDRVLASVGGDELLKKPTVDHRTISGSNLPVPGRGREGPQTARPNRSRRARRRSAIRTRSSHTTLAGEPSVAGHEQRRFLLRLSACRVATQPDFVEPLSCLIATYRKLQ